MGLLLRFLNEDSAESGHCVDGTLNNAKGEQSEYAYATPCDQRKRRRDPEEIAGKSNMLPTHRRAMEQEIIGYSDRC